MSDSTSVFVDIIYDMVMLGLCVWWLSSVTAFSVFNILGGILFSSWIIRASVQDALERVARKKGRR